VNTRGEVSPTYLSSDFYTAVNHARPTPLDDRPDSDPDYSAASTFRPGQWLSRSTGHGGTKRTADGVQRGTDRPSFDEISEADSEDDDDDDDDAVAGGRQGRQLMQTTPAGTATAASTSTATGRWTADDYDLYRDADDDRRDATSSPKHSASSTSRSVGTEEIRTAEATTTTDDYELERSVEYSTSARYSTARQRQQRHAADDDYSWNAVTTTTTTAAGPDDYDYDDDDDDDDATAATTKAMYSTPHRT